MVGASPKIRQSAWKGAMYVYALLFYAFLYVPIIVLVLLSFNDAQVMGFPLKGFTLRWYGEAFSGGRFMVAIGNSLLIGVASAILGTLLGLSVCMGLRYRLPGRGVLIPLLLLPIITPGIVAGVILFVFFGSAGVRYGLWPAVLVAHVTWVLPFAFLTLYPRLHRFDQSLEEAAMDLGATPFVVFRRVVFPLIRPGVVATFLFAFTLSFDEFIRTLFLVGSQRTMPVQLWILIQEEVAPFLPAVGVVIMVFTASAAALGFVVSSRAGRLVTRSEAGRTLVNN